MDIEDLLGEAKAKGASDLLVMVGDAPAMRVAGQWIRFELPRCGKEYLHSQIQQILKPDMWKELLEKRDLDFSFSSGANGRVRCNAHFQRDHLAIVLRLVWPEIPNPRSLGIPNHVIRMGEVPQGLILVSGPTGSGKSTTMAAIVENINQNKPSHIITIEDPIEFIYSNKRSIIEQREIGADTATWQTGLRNVLRQAPDVIVLGELRDLESMAIALTAAETGHLVIASVHSSTAAGAISRFVDAFPTTQSAQVRLQLSQALRMVFTQRLLPGRAGDIRVLSFEILINTPAVSNMIRTNEIEQIPNAINAGREHGMMSFLQCERDLISRDLIQKPEFH